MSSSSDSPMTMAAKGRRAPASRSETSMLMAVGPVTRMSVTPYSSSHPGLRSRSRLTSADGRLGRLAGPRDHLHQRRVAALVGRGLGDVDDARHRRDVLRPVVDGPHRVVAGDDPARQRERRVVALAERRGDRVVGLPLRRRLRGGAAVGQGQLEVAGRGGSQQQPAHHERHGQQRHAGDQPHPAGGRGPARRRRGARSARRGVGVDVDGPGVAVRVRTGRRAPAAAGARPAAARSPAAG